MNRNVLLAVAAYAVWGVLPIFWKALQPVAAVEVLAHRVVWSLVLLVGVLAARRQWQPLLLALRDRRVLITSAVTAVVLMVNWGVYIWAVQIGHVVETSLGYFINPLLSVSLGVLLLGERLRRGQWLALSLAAAGVAWLTFAAGRLPWIALILAGSFALYGLLRKTANVNALEGLTLETAAVALPAAAFLLYRANLGEAAFLQQGLTIDILLIGAGIVTALPLLLFGAAARNIPLSLLGVLQYIAPTTQFLLGLLLYREPFSASQLVGFGLIWSALLVFTLESLRHRRRILAPAAAQRA
jgi:chloramphenicol-sensitive protein RarD